MRLHLLVCDSGLCVSECADAARRHRPEAEGDHAEGLQERHVRGAGGHQCGGARPGHPRGGPGHPVLAAKRTAAVLNITSVYSAEIYFISLRPDHTINDHSKNNSYSFFNQSTMITTQRNDILRIFKHVFSFFF